MGGHLGSSSKSTLNRLGDHIYNNSNRFRRIIVSRYGVIDERGIGITVDKGNNGNTKTICFGHRDQFVIRIDNKKCSRKAFEVQHPLEISMHAGHLPLDCRPLFAGKSIQTSVLLHTKIFLVLGQTGGHRLKIRQGAAHPAVDAERGIGGSGHFPDGFLGLPLCSNQKNGFTASHHVLDRSTRLFQKVVGLFEVNDGYAMPICVNVRLGLGIPSAQLVPEMDSGVE